MNSPDESEPEFEAFQNYQQTIDYLYSRLPIFTRVGASAYKADLNNTLALTARLGNPHREFKTIHIAGTNGKGSSSHMLAAVLQVAGYKTGLYTSPHLIDFRERIRINGEMISEEEVISFVNGQRSNIELISPSFFEMTVAMAFDHFRNHKVDIAVIETGLGGRLDSTNIINPELCLITNIGFDHMNILGSTLPEIAREKAGIIKQGVPVILSQKQEEVLQVFREKAELMQSELIIASEQWNIRQESSSPAEHLTLLAESISGESENQAIESDLKGLYQLHNIAGLMSAAEVLRKKGFRISPEHVSSALKQVQALTGLMGRWQTLQTKPLIICDTGHNADGIREILKNIAHTPHNRLHWILGMVNDKDISSVLKMLPRDAVYYFCAPDMPRARPADELQREAFAAGLHGDYYASVKAAFQAAKDTSANDDLILVAGSTFVVAEVL